MHRHIEILRLREWIFQHCYSQCDMGKAASTCWYWQSFSRNNVESAEMVRYSDFHEIFADSTIE